MKYIICMLLLSVVAIVSCTAAADADEVASLYGRSRDAFFGDDYKQALPLAYEAYDKSLDLGDAYWIGLTARGIANIYESCHSYGAAFRYQDIACSNFEACGDSIEFAETLLQSATARYSFGDTATCVGRLRRLLGMDSEYCDTLRRVLALRCVARMRMDGGDNAGAAVAIDEIVRMGRPSAQDSAMLALIAVSACDWPVARSFIEALGDRGGAVMHNVRLRYFLHIGDVEAAMEARESIIKGSKGYYSELLGHELSDALEAYHEANKALGHQEMQKMKIIVWLTVCVAFMAVLSLCLFLAMYRRRKNAQAEAAFQMAADLRRMCSESDSARDIAKRQLVSLLRERNEMLDRVCRIAYESPNQKVAEKNLAKAVDEFVGWLTRDKAGMERMERLVNSNFDNLLVRLRADMPKIKDVDYSLYVFSVLGFSAGAIAFLTGVERTSIIYDRKRRLRKKLEALDSGGEYVGMMS